MKYYTIDQAVKKAEKEKSSFIKEIDMSPSMGMYNCLRGLFGYKPKMYYFFPKHKQNKYDITRIEI